MKNQAYRIDLLLIILLLAISSCKQQSKSDNSQNEDAVSAVAAPTDGVQKMSEYDYSDTINSGGRTYVYTIHREPAPDMPTVRDEMGYVFADNIYSLRVTHNGKAIIARTFTKQDFARFLSDAILEGGIMDGLIYDASQPGLHFAACVSIPQSDMSEPFILNFDERGGMTIEKDNRPEIDIVEEEDGV